MLGGVNSVLVIFFEKLNGAPKYQHFLFEVTNPGVAGAHTEFLL